MSWGPPANSVAAAAAVHGTSRPLAAARAGALLAAVAAAWWVTLDGRLRTGEALEIAPRTVQLFLAISIAGRFAGLALETLFYRAWWKSTGARFRFTPPFLAFAALSLLDAWTATLHDLARQDGAFWPLGLAILAGPGAAGDPEGMRSSGAAVAFAGAGLLTAARIGGTAWVQARETGRGAGPALALTGAAWLAMRMLAWWTFDLVRGASPS